MSVFLCMLHNVAAPQPPENKKNKHKVLKQTKHSCLELSTLRPLLLQIRCSEPPSSATWIIIFCMTSLVSHIIMKFWPSLLLIIDVWYLVWYLDVWYLQLPFTPFPSGLWATVTPCFFSSSGILLKICCCAWTHCPVAWHNLSQALAVGQIGSHLTLEYSGIQRRLTRWLHGAQVLLVQNKSKLSAVGSVLQQAH